MHDKAGALLLANESRYQPDLLIKEWQQTVLSGKCEPADKSLVTELCGQCCYVLREVVRLSKDADISQKVSNNLRRTYGSLKLWDDAFQVSQGKLDEVLDRNKVAKRATLRILSNIARSLVKIALITSASEDIPRLAAELQQTLQVVPWNGHDEEDGSTDDDDDDNDDSDSYIESDFDDLDELTMNIATGVDCLMDLEQLYNSPTLDSEPDIPTVIAAAEWKPEQSYCDRISQRFPEADIKLVVRLGRANYHRYLRCIGARETADEEREYEATKVVAGGAGSSAHVSDFHDSGVGSSVPTTSYAETMMSYAHKKGNIVRVPPLPEDAKNGLPFRCIACGKHVRIQHNSAWKKHVVSDLQPYVCLDISCPSDEVFQNLNDWTTHVISAHLLDSERRPCPLCMEQMGDNLFPVIQHLRRHLEEISLASLPVSQELDSASDLESLHEEHEEYEVDDVLGERPNPDIPGTILYLVKWKDPDLPEYTWEPEEALPLDLRNHWKKTKKDIDAGLRKPYDLGSYEAGEDNRKAHSVEPPVKYGKHRACMICRRRKLRCDGLRPSCRTCTRLGHSCTYDKVMKEDGPKGGYVKALEEKLKQVEELLINREPDSTTSPEVAKTPNECLIDAVATTVDPTRKSISISSRGTSQNGDEKPQPPESSIFNVSAITAQHDQIDKPSFRNSHFNAAYYGNPSFQPEMYVPDDDDETLKNEADKDLGKLALNLEDQASTPSIAVLCPFPTCDKAFNSEYELNGHTISSHVGQHCIVSKSPPFKCRCGANFTWLKDLMRHIRGREEDLVYKYPCNMCSRSYRGNTSFSRKDHLIQHLRGFHKVDDSGLAEIMSTTRNNQDITPHHLRPPLQKLPSALPQIVSLPEEAYEGDGSSHVWTQGDEFL
ncbi:hypothetical protein HD806DRAFT_534594 [Xylariaceae sp. AK1471]|nr:hypothetical protein HD806DRAFT_534594 [Xylariaceae sp. AK1471]